MPTQSFVTPRKAPKQQRSRATVDAILTATGLVLAEHGYDSATTNLIARRAGVSVGSLYQYFPNKEALVAALAEQHALALSLDLVAVLDRAEGRPLRETLVVLVERLVAHHAEQGIHQILIELAPRVLGHDWCKDVDGLVERAIAANLAQRPERLRPRDLGVAVFMLVQGVKAITHAAVLDRPDALASGMLAHELVGMIERYLVGDALNLSEDVAQGARPAG